MKNLIPARATVIIPTFGYAPFAVWAIQSVQRQTVDELEICIICDGSPDEMVETFEQMSHEDPRIRVFRHEKSPRTGEPYRDEAIRKTTGKIICYCAHDDLLLPNHVESMEKTLRNNDFTHSIHASVNIPSERNQGLFMVVYAENMKDAQTLERLHNNNNFFGLTFGAHTRSGYFELNEGWVTTPDPNIPTDLYMWKKLADKFPGRVETTFHITALCFPKPFRETWSEDQRAHEISEFYAMIQEPNMINDINQGLLNYLYRQLRITQNLQKHIDELTMELESKNAQISSLHADKISAEHLAAKQVSLKYLLRRLSGEVWRRIITGHR